jgi:hypothetical protein
MEKMRRTESQNFVIITFTVPESLAICIEIAKKK